MSRDTKAGYTDCQGHGTSPFPVAIRDELNEPERSVRPVSSFVSTICASDTDEGDYETSSEGMVLSRRNFGILGAQAKESLYVHFKGKTASLSKRSALDRNVSSIKREISDPPRELVENRLTRETTYVRDSLIVAAENLAQSKSLPILKNKIPDGISTDFTAADIALIPASSSARKRKMSTIIKKMESLISPYSSTNSLATDATINLRSQQFKTERFTWRNTLPILCDKMVINDGRSEEFLAKVTLNETRINRREMNWNSQDAIAVVNDEGTANVTNEDDLVDIARNSCPSVKSVYFSPDVSGPLPSMYEPGKLRIPQRVSNDVETLLKIEQELGPLRYRYSEIIGKARALSLGLDICHPNQPDAFARSVLSPSLSYYFPDCAETRLGRATSVIKNRSGLVDKTSPSSTFSVVGKPTPRGSRISWLNENGSNRRQEALSYIGDEPSRAFECHDGPRFSNRGRNSTSYLPAADSHTFRRENVLDDRSRNVCVSNSNFQPYREPKPVIEKATSARNGRYVREAVNSSSFFNGTEYSSHEYLNRTAENPRTSADNSFEIRRQKSLISIAEVADNNFPIVNERMANERSSKCSSGDPNATAAEFVERGSNYHKSFPSETEHIAKGDQISSSLALRSIDSDASSDHGIRVISTSACAPEIRFVSVNTELRTTVGKRYTNRANSPIQHLPVVSPTTTRPSNVFFNATMSSVFVQQVRTDSSREVTKIESPTKIHSVDAGNQDAPANVTGKRDFCVQKVDSRPAAEDLPRSSKLERNGENSTGEFGKTRYLSRPKEKITIVPIVLADGMSGSSGIADVDFAIPRYAIKTEPKLNYRIISFDGRKLREEQSSSSRNDAGYRRDIADPVRLIEEPADEEHSRPGKTHYRRFSRHLYAKVNRLPSATSVTRNPKQSIQIPISNVVGGAREREFGERRVAKTIPGMTSTPEDFLCET